MDILVTNQSEVEVEVGKLKALAAFVLEKEGAVDGTDVSVALVDSGKIQELNLKYRRIDRPTDVLSFDLSDDGKLSGEIVISPQIALENAAVEATGETEEIESLVIHGLLHLLGYTHDHDDDSEVMFDRHELIRREFTNAGGTS